MKLKVGTGLALLIASAAGWLFVAPTQLGGSTTYVTTHGDSMEPGFRTGDLAIIRPTRSYKVGDVTAYHSTELSTVVMHRIVAVKDGRYTLQGDNNDFLDPDQPTAEQLIGTLALRVPQAGRWLDRLTSPLALGVMTLVSLLSGGTTAVLTRRQRRKKTNTVKPTPLPPALRELPPVLRTAGAIAAALATASMAVGLISWTRPLTSAATAQAPAESTSTMTFSYQATVPQSAAYDGTTVTQPQPVFRKLADEVDVEFTYDSEAPVGSATVQVTAELSTANGWQSSVSLGSPQTFTGSTHTGRVQLQLSELQARADAAAKAIGEEPAGDVTVTVVPEITLGAEPVFRPELPFTLNATALRLASPEPQFVVSHSGSAPAVGGEQAPASLPLLGKSILVAQARAAAVGGIALAALAAVVLLVLARRARRAPEPAAIEARYAQLLLGVNPMVLPAGRPVVEVPGIEALARLAERYGLFVMHWERGGVHTYLVVDDATTYRYRAGADVPRAVAAQNSLADS